MRTRTRASSGHGCRSSASCASTAARRAEDAAGKTAKNESPSVLDDQAVVRLDRRPHDVVMLLEQRRVRVTQVLDEPRAALDVGEQERDGSRRQVTDAGTPQS